MARVSQGWFRGSILQRQESCGSNVFPSLPCEIALAFIPFFPCLLPLPILMFIFFSHNHDTIFELIPVSKLSPLHRASSQILLKQIYYLLAS